MSRTNIVEEAQALFRKLGNYKEQAGANQHHHLRPARPVDRSGEVILSYEYKKAEPEKFRFPLEMLFT